MSRQRVACPSCVKSGGDRSSNNLVLFADSTTRGYCHVCSSVQTIDGEITRTGSSLRTNQIEVSAINSYPIRALKHKPISKEACERFGVRVSVDETSGEINRVYYPTYDPDGVITGYQTRQIPKGDFPSVGKLTGLFGKYQSKKKGKMLILTEGPDDMLCVWEMLKAKGKNYNVNSVLHGADRSGTVDATIRKELEWISSHEVVVLWFDTDEPGKLTAKALAELLVSDTKVRIVEGSLKDAGEMYKRGMIEEMWSCLMGAKEFKPDTVTWAHEIDRAQLLTPSARGIYLDCLPKFSHKIRGLRPSEMTTILSPSNTGKTSLCREIHYELLIKQPGNVGAIFLEETGIKTRQGIIALHAKVPLNLFREDPSRADKKLVNEAIDSLLTRWLVYESKKEVIDDDALLNQIKYMVRVGGCEYVILDHLSFVISSRKDNNERQAIDQLLTKLARSVEELRYHLILVSHIKRAQRERQKSDDSKKYPYWELLNMDDGRGSGAIEQLSHNVVGIERQVLDPSETEARGLTRLRLMKNREHSTLGICDVITMDQTTGHIKPVEVEY